MLFGAYAGFVVAYHGDSSWLGFGAGMLAGAVISLTMVLFCVRLGLDQIVVGIAIVLGAEGATALIFDSQFAESRPTLPAVSRVSIPGLSDLPVVGGKGESDGSLFSQPLVFYLGLALVVVVAWMLRRTHLGLNVKAAGDRPDARRRRRGASSRPAPWPSCSRARWPARRGLPRDRERGPVPGHARRRTRFHRDRSGDARPRPAALGRRRRLPLRRVAVDRRLGAGRGLQHLHGRRLHAPVRPRPPRPRPLRPAVVPAGRPRTGMRRESANERRLHARASTSRSAPARRWHRRASWPRSARRSPTTTTRRSSGRSAGPSASLRRSSARRTTLLMQGEAVLGLEAAARSLVRPGTPVLNLVSGVFGKGMALVGVDRQADRRATPYNVVEPDAVDRYLREHEDIELVTVVHSETPSGTLNDVSAIGPIAVTHGALTLVDCVSSVGGIPLETDAWQLDVCVGGPQKCLAGPPGMSLMTVSDAAWERIRANPAARARPSCRCSTGRSSGSTATSSCSHRRWSTCTASRRPATSCSTKGSRRRSPATTWRRAPAAPVSRRWGSTSGLARRRSRPRASRRSPCPTT